MNDDVFVDKPKRRPWLIGAVVVLVILLVAGGSILIAVRRPSPKPVMTHNYRSHQVAHPNSSKSAPSSMNSTSDTSNSANTTNSAKTALSQPLSNSGPGNTVLVFVVATTVATLAYWVYVRRTLRQRE